MFRQRLPGLWPDAGLHAFGRLGDRGSSSGRCCGRPRPCCKPTLDRAVARSHRINNAVPITRVLPNDRGLRDIDRSSVWSMDVYLVGCRVSCRARRSTPDFGVCRAGVDDLAECWLVLLCRFGSSAGLPVDRWFGVPDRAVWSSPGGDTTCGHGQLPAAFVDEVVMLLT